MGRVNHAEDVGDGNSGWWARHALIIAAMAVTTSAATALAAVGGMSAIAVTNGLPSQVIPTGRPPQPPVVVPEPIDPPDPPQAEADDPESTVPDPRPTPPDAAPLAPTFTMTQSPEQRQTESGRRFVTHFGEPDRSECDERTWTWSSE